MFRVHGFPRALGASALVLCVIAPAASSEAPPTAFKQDPRAAQRAAAAKRAPTGTAVPSERYLAAAAHLADMPSYSTAAPSLDATATVVGTWAELGPSNVGGRTRALLVQPAHRHWYAAGVAGGVFKTTDAGVTWTDLGDAMANMAVSALASKPGTPNTLLAGTGEGYFNEDLVRGAGIFQTTNGGTTWTQLASTNNANFHYVNDLVWSTNPPFTNVYAATSTGVFRSINSGSTWTQILAPAINGGCLDLSLAPGAGDFLLASCGTFTTAKVYRAQGTTAATIANWTVVLSEAGMGRTSLSETTSGSRLRPVRGPHHPHPARGLPLRRRRRHLGPEGRRRERPPQQPHPPERVCEALLRLRRRVRLVRQHDRDRPVRRYGQHGLERQHRPLPVARTAGSTWSPMSSWWEEGQPYHVPAGQHALDFGDGRHARGRRRAASSK